MRPFPFRGATFPMRMCNALFVEDLVGPTFWGYLRRVGKISPVVKGDAYAISSVSGLFTSGQAINGCQFAMRSSPAAKRNVYITHLRVQWCVTVAFATAVTAGRRLEVYRGSGAAASAGTALATPGAATPIFSPPSVRPAWGDIRIAAATTLTVTGITFETQPIEGFQTAGWGAAAAYVALNELRQPGSSPIIPASWRAYCCAQCASHGCINGSAVANWQIGVEVEWHEA